MEIQEKNEGQQYPGLRLVHPSELNAEVLASDAVSAQEQDSTNPTEDLHLEAVMGSAVKDNRLTIDDNSRQSLSHKDIEALKQTSDGKAIIEKILASHTAFDEKTEFSKAKYTLRKARKYLKRVTLLPMEIGYLIEYILEKEPSRILDLREESVGLIGSWSNVHWHAANETRTLVDGKQIGNGRVLVVDDSGGLITAALAERMGILRKLQSSDCAKDAHADDVPMRNGDDGPISHDSHQHRDFALPVQANTLTVVHSAAQANVSLLKYFGYDTNQPDVDHPLHEHLKCLSWLQLLSPEEDPLHKEPEIISDEVLRTWKPGRRGAYFKKRRRWLRTMAVGEDARAGSFDTLVVATHMDLVSVLSNTIHLLRGGAQVVIYSPAIEPLVGLMDLYSKERRTAFLNHIVQHGQKPESEDFKLDPRLLLAPNLQTSRVRDYQVLPGRTHPLMTSRGCSEGYIMTAQRVIPIAGGVEARGAIGKKRKLASIDLPNV